MCDDILKKTSVTFLPCGKCSYGGKMKRKNYSILVIGCLTLLVFSSCASKVKADKPKVAVKGFHSEFTDWQSASTGGSIPEWVEAVLNSDSEDTIRELLKKPKGYRIWALNNQGENLDALKMLTDNFDIQTMVASSISQNVAQDAERILIAEGATDKAKIAEQSAAVASMVTTNLTLNGLERVTGYWTKYYMADKKGNAVEGESGKERYSYIVVMGMEGERFNAQLDAAMQKIEKNTAEDEYLRKLSSAVITNLKLKSALSEYSEFIE